MTVYIDHELCDGCGICADICPRHIPELSSNGSDIKMIISEERGMLCMDCGHCVAVCPNGAIYLDGAASSGFSAICEQALDADDLLTLMQQRRSVRRYKNRPVPREVIDHILEAAKAAPTGSGRSTTGVIVIDRPQILAELSELTYDLYEKLETGMRNPIARMFIKRSAGEKQYRTMENFLMPGMHWYIRWYREGRSNEILRDCPALLLFHSPVEEPVAAENCVIAAFHSILMAQALGLGTCFNDILPPACNRVTEIRELLDLQAGREVYSSVTMGYPKYRFRQVPTRTLTDVRYIE